MAMPQCRYRPSSTVVGVARKSRLPDLQRGHKKIGRQLWVRNNQAYWTLKPLRYSQQPPKEKDEEIALPKEEGTRMPCMSVKKQEANADGMKKKVELMRGDPSRIQRNLPRADTSLLEALQIPK